ncbi:MAG: hypothetical protein DRP74_08385 [Candidatus Omnitrophota bacterium]|nr:MAG: hypothetical protein DRP74_08385 [Candidatus Omnitrophota bacterium]
MARAKEGNGNYSLTATAAVTVDTTAPVIDWVTKPTAHSSSGVFYVVATDATTAVSTIEYQVVGITGWTASGVSTFTLASTVTASFDTAWLFSAETDRTVQVEVRAIDELGNITTPPISYSYRYDTQPPTAATAEFITDKKIVVPFSEEVASPDASLFAASADGTTINGASASVLADQTKVEITLESSVPATWLTGDVTLVFDEGAVVDLAGNPVPAGTSPITADTTAPRYVGGEFINHDTAVIQFSEALSAVSAASFSITGVDITEATLSATQEVTLTLSGLTTQLQSSGATLNILSGAVVDWAGNEIAPAAVWISADTTAPEMLSVQATPSLVSSQTVNINITFNEKMAQANPVVAETDGTVIVSTGEWNDAQTMWTGVYIVPEPGQITSFTSTNVMVYGAKDRAQVEMALSTMTVSPATVWVVNRGPDIELGGTPSPIEIDGTWATSAATIEVAISAAVPAAASGSGVSVASVEYNITTDTNIITTQIVTVSPPTTPVTGITFAVALSDAHTYVINVNAVDTLGNISSFSATLQVDRTPPTSQPSARFIGLKNLNTAVMEVEFNEPITAANVGLFNLTSGATPSTPTISGAVVFFDVDISGVPDVLTDGDTLSISSGGVYDLVMNPVTNCTVDVAGDTFAPAVSDVTGIPSSPVSEATIAITVEFTEVMDQTVAPVVKLISPATETTVTGSWVDFNTWAGSFSVGSTNEGDNYVQVTGAEDWAGNPMETYESDHFTVDTTKPQITSITVNPDPVPAGTSSVIFTVVFNEDMNESVEPTVTIGKASPYETYTVEGGWSDDDGRTWIGSFEVPGDMAAGTYHVKVAGAQDTVGNVMDPDTSKTFTVIAERVEEVIGKAGGTVEMEGVAEVNIPEEALDTNQTISIEMIDPADAPEFPEDTYLTPAGLYVEFGPAGLVFNKPVTITIYYSQDVIDSLGLDENELTLYVWDGVQWRRVGGVVDTDTNTITVEVNHFSLFTVVEDTEPAPAFGVTLSKNPFLSSDGTFFSYSLPKAGKVTLKIYDATGDLVRTLLDGEERAAGKYEADVKWNGYNDFGNFVGSGIYIYKFEVEYTAGGSDKKIGTVGVIK